MDPCLSVGEQQRLAFVRALIYEPAWLFMDESTSALDEETEKAMYELLLSRLARTTLISVGHRSTLVTYHTAALTLHKETKEAFLEPLPKKGGGCTHLSILLEGKS